MSSGDAVNVISQVTASATLDIQPGSGIEWIIHNILVPEGLSTGVELYATDGTHSIHLATLTRSLTMCNFHLSNTHYLQLKNLESTTQNLGADGIVMK